MMTNTHRPTRHYGDRAVDTDWLSVTEIAALIVADLITISADPDLESVFPDRIHYAAHVYPRHETIQLDVYGLTDAELADPYQSPADGIIDTVASRYGWTSADPDDRRFLMHVTTLDETRQHASAAEVGTVAAYPHHVPPWLLP